MLDAVAAPPAYDDCVRHIAEFPERLRARVEGLSDEQLAAQYRPASWTVRQVVHHCADSHMHAITRAKRALTEDQPTIHGYEEHPTAYLPDYALPLAPTLALLDGLHVRFAALLGGLTPQQRARTYFHAGNGRDFSLADHAAMYSWHGRHHLAHVEIALGVRTS